MSATDIERGRARDADASPRGQLRLSGVTKRFDDNIILDSIELSIQSGEFLTLLGPSGCGKTTTLNSIAGFTEIDEGSIVLDGQDITQLPPYRRDSSMVVQQYALFPHLRVRDNVAYGLKVRKMTKSSIDERVNETLAMVGITELADRFPSQLSGGQQQRVAVARAVAVVPAVLLMDEPLSNLDAKLREEVRVELRALQQRLRQSVVFVTHDQQEALAVSDRVAVLNRGKIEQVGPPTEVYNSPATSFVADFMGVANIFAGRVSGGVFHAEVGFRVPVPEGRFGESNRVCAVGFRPSAVSLSGAPEGGSGRAIGGDVTLLGELASVSYIGDSLRAEIDIAGRDNPVQCSLAADSAVPDVGVGVAVHIAQTSLHWLSES